MKIAHEAPRRLEPVEATWFPRARTPTSPRAKEFLSVTCPGRRRIVAWHTLGRSTSKGAGGRRYSL